MMASFLSGVGFSYTSHTGFIFIWGVSLTHPMLSFCVVSFSYTSHAGFFLSFFNVRRNSSLHIPCWLHFYLGSFSYTSHADFIFYCGQFILHIPYWLFFLSWEFLLHIPCLHYFSVGFSLTHPMLAYFRSFLVWGVSLTNPVQAFFFFFFFFF